MRYAKILQTRGIKKFSSTCGSSLQGDHMINNSQWLLKSWRQSQLEDAGEADTEKQIFHLCNSNTFWEMKKTFLLKVHVFFLAKRNSWRNIIARVVTGDKLWLEKNCKVYLDSDLPHLLAGGGSRFRVFVSPPFRRPSLHRDQLVGHPLPEKWHGGFGHNQVVFI